MATHAQLEVYIANVIVLAIHILDIALISVSEQDEMLAEFLETAHR